MTIKTVTRVVYIILGIIYVVLGVGSMLLPAGWLPENLTNDFLRGEIPSPFFAHLLQEFGTVVLALGLVFLWYAKRNVLSRSFHWAMTFYFALDALIHWIGPEGVIGTWSRGVINSIPFVVLLLVGLLQLRETNQIPDAAQGGIQ